MEIPCHEVKILFTCKHCHEQVRISMCPSDCGITNHRYEDDEFIEATLSCPKCGNTTEVTGL